MVRQLVFFSLLLCINAKCCWAGDSLLGFIVGSSWRRLHIEHPNLNQVPERNCVFNKTLFTRKIPVDDTTDLYRVPHSTIFIDGVSCGSLSATADDSSLWFDNYMLLAKSQLVLDRNSSTIAMGALRRDLFDPNDRHGKARTMYNSLVEFGMEVWVGYHATSDLVCGNKTILPRTSFAIFSRSQDRQLDIGGFIDTSAAPNEIVEYMAGDLIYVTFDEPFSEKNEYKDRIVRYLLLSMKRLGLS
jgi:hypothetical protein